MGVFRIRTALVVAGALALAGCETVSDLNPFSKETVLPGEREALFDNTDPVSAATGGKASVGSPSGVTWSQGAGNARKQSGQRLGVHLGRSRLACLCRRWRRWSLLGRGSHCRTACHGRKPGLRLQSERSRDRPFGQRRTPLDTQPSARGRKRRRIRRRCRGRQRAGLCRDRLRPACRP